jgi:uncharacterized integral membrane protein
VKWVKALFWIVLFAVVILFSFHNKDEVALRFGVYPLRTSQWEVSGIPLFLVILCSVFLGVVIGSIGDLHRHFQFKKTIRQNQRMIERLEREIQSLGSGPGFEKTSFLQEDL